MLAWAPDSLLLKLKIKVDEEKDLASEIKESEDQEEEDSKLIQ